MVAGAEGGCDVGSVSCTSFYSGPRVLSTVPGVRLQPGLQKTTVVMAMFEQMRANVGKLLKGIDRSEFGWRARSGQAGWRRRGASRGG